MEIHKDEKSAFRAERCNIVRMSQDKVAIVPKGTPVLLPLQSEEKFNSLLDEPNWAVTQTAESNIIFFDLDVNNYDKNLDKFFNRRRDKYIGNNERINSKHGFIKVIDADHAWCVEFAKKYHNVSGIEIYAEKHWMIFAGTYKNDKNIDKDRKTTWYRKDDLHPEPILEVTKKDLGEVFGSVMLAAKSTSKKSDGIVPKGRGLRHAALQQKTISVMYKIDQKNKQARKHNTKLRNRADKLKKPINETKTKKEIPITFDTIYDAVINTKTIEGIEEYAVGQPKHNELKDMIDWSYEKYLNDELDGLGFSILENTSLIITHDDDPLIRKIHSYLEYIKIYNKRKKTDAQIHPSFNSVYDYLMIEHERNGNGFDISEQLNEELKHKHLEDIMVWMLYCTEDGSRMFMLEYMIKLGVHFAHILRDDDQFNCWVWDDRRWSPNVGEYVFSIYSQVGFEGTISSNISVELGRAIAIHSKTLKVDLESKEYNKQIKNYITNTYGQYYDFRDGKIYDVDPETMFYKNPDLQVKLNTDLPESKEFDDFLNLYYSKESIDLLVDHLAGSFLHTSVLGQKAKVTYIVGPHDTYKSVIIMILKKIIYTRSFSEVSPQAIGERFGMSLIGGNLINCQEEQSTAPSKDASGFKDAITKEDGFTESKYGKSQTFFNRYPRHTMACNKIMPIPEDDEDDSIFVRLQYIPSVMPKNNNKDWRDILYSDDQIQMVAMLLLRRAHKIFTKEKPIRYQSMDEVKLMYDKLTHGTLLAMLKEHYKYDSAVLTSTEFIWREYREYSGSKVSRDTFNSMLLEIGKIKENGNFYPTDTLYVYSRVQNSNGADRTRVTVIPDIRPIKDPARDNIFSSKKSKDSTDKPQDDKTSLTPQNNTTIPQTQLNNDPQFWACPVCHQDSDDIFEINSPDKDGLYLIDHRAKGHEPHTIPESAG